jgi:hypothetical protein
MGKYLIAILALMIALSIGASLSQEDEQQMQDQRMQNQTSETQQPVGNGNESASLMVEDQELTNNTLAISRAMIDKPGWIVVQNVQDGRLGGIVGFSRLDQGTRNNLRIPIAANATTGNLVAELHYDMGTIGCFEYPGADVEVMRKGMPVLAPFAVTIGQELQQRISEQQQQMQQLMQQGQAQMMGQVQPTAEQDQTMGQNMTMDQNMTADQNMTMEQNQTMDMGMSESQTES